MTNGMDSTAVSPAWTHAVPRACVLSGAGYMRQFLGKSFSATVRMTSWVGNSAGDRDEIQGQQIRIHMDEQFEDCQRQGRRCVDDGGAGMVPTPSVEWRAFPVHGGVASRA